VTAIKAHRAYYVDDRINLASPVAIDAPGGPRKTISSLELSGSACKHPRTARWSGSAVRIRHYPRTVSAESQAWTRNATWRSSGKAATVR